MPDSEFPGLPTPCDVDEWALRPISFEPVDRTDDRVALQGEYVEEAHDDFDANVYVLTAHAERGLADELAEYCRHLRVFFRSVTATDEMLEFIQALQHVDDHDGDIDTFVDVELPPEAGIILEVSDENNSDVGMIVAALIDPSIKAGKWHGYHSVNKESTVKMTVTGGTVQLKKVQGPDPIKHAGQKTAWKDAGDKCAALGHKDGSSYYFSMGWERN